LTIDVANRVGARNTSCFQVYSAQGVVTFKLDLTI
jgi:hypothetical protein